MDIPKKGDSLQVSSATSTVCVTLIPVKFKDIVVEMQYSNEHAILRSAIAIQASRLSSIEVRPKKYQRVKIGEWHRHMSPKGPQSRGPVIKKIYL